MTSSADAIEGPQIHSTPFPPDWLKYLGLIGVGVGAVALGAALTGKIEGFDIYTPSPADSTEGYRAETPPNQTEGFETPAMEDMNVTFMGEPTSPVDQSRIKEIIDDANLAPSGGKAFKVMIVPSETLSEVVRANDAFYAGVPLQQVMGEISPEAQYYFGTMAQMYENGQNIIVTDRAVGFGLQLFPGERINFFVTRGVH